MTLCSIINTMRDPLLNLMRREGYLNSKSGGENEGRKEERKDN
jgi:hypothetical protein